MAMLVAVGTLLCVTHILAAVNRPPNMVINPEQEIYYKPGESVEMKCVGDGTPKPLYKWKRNGIDFNPSGNDERVVQLPNQGTLVFNAPEDKDEGIFQCFVDNGYGVAVSYTVNFREAKLARFPYEARKVVSANAGEPVTLPCIPPQSFPPADVYWVIKEPDGRWQAINFDKRVSMDIEDRLRITNVKKSDEMGQRAYSCMAINYFMRDNAIGPEYEIKVLGTAEQKSPAAELWTSPSGQSFLKGSTLRLKCIFSGNPTPDVYWERLDDVLPDRHSFKSFGQELQISDVRESDSGLYECLGLNTESQQRATKAFTVTIRSMPQWTNRPENQEKSVDEKATFHCVAQYATQYMWYVNGVPVDDTKTQNGTRDPRIYKNPRVTVSANMLVIRNLTLEDHMNIQCNASNNDGYVFADVYLNVMAGPPSILVHPPPFTKVAEGHSVLITCSVAGKPDPIITWYRDSNLITGGRFKILPNGDLNISNVVMADAGNYKCQASNKYASNITSSACIMHVRRKTRIEQFPEDLEVIAGNDAKFTCSGSTDFDEADNMIVYWEKDDKQISTTENRMVQNFQDNSLTISGTIVRDSGVYTCVITNGLDEDRSYAFLTVKSKPDPPSSVEVERCRDNTADIKWIKGIENNAPVNYFVVQYNTTFNPDQWVSAATIDYSQNTATIDLSPWVNYTFRVVATNKIGASVPSAHTSKVCTTAVALPTKNPQNIRAIGDTRSKLKIEWVAMNPIDYNAPNLKYQITIQRQGDLNPSTYVIDSATNNSMEISASQAYFPYNVKVQAKNSQGESKANVQNLTLYSYEDIPAATVSDVTVSEVSATSAVISFSWLKVWLEKSGQMDSIRGEFKGFKIQYWRDSEKLSTFREVEIPIAEITPANLPTASTRITTDYRLTSLSPASHISLQICVLNNFYVSAPSAITTFTTAAGVPGPVQYFEALTSSSNSFSLYWVAPALEDQNGEILGFDISYQTVNALELGAMHDRDQQIDDRYATTAILSGLLPDTKYRVHIYARTQYGRGEGTFIEVRTLEKSTFSAPDFDIRDVTESSFNVTWAAPPQWGVHIVHYIEWRKTGQSDWQQTTDEVISNYKVITNLEKGTYYEVRVVAYDGFHRMYSGIEEVGTVGFAKARSIAANYGWFIGMLLSGLVFIGVVVFIYLIHRKRKGVEEAPRSKSNYKGTSAMRPDSEYDRDSREQYNDYYKDERYDDYQPEGLEEPSGDTDKGYVDYKRDSYGYDRDDERDYARRPDDDYYDDEYDDDYDRDYNDIYDRNYDNRDDYDYDQNYDPKDRYDDGYDRDDYPPAYRNPSYAPADRFEDEPYNEDFRLSADDRAYEEYSKDSSAKFDDDGVPLEKPPPASSTSV